MIRASAITTLVVLSLGVSGCAELTHLTRERDLKPAEGSFRVNYIDAKQRAVVAGATPTKKTTYRYKTPAPDPKGAAPKPSELIETTVEVTNGARFCAEPSPDALSALAASGSLGLSQADKVQLSAALGLSEGASSIGLRTQSIQLMRDAMYRVCEGYLSGALSEGAYETLNRRFQSSMVAILAIEQLTGAVRARQVVLGGSTSVGAAEAALKATSLAQDAKTAVDNTQKALDAAKEKQATADTAQKTAQKAVDDAGANVTEAQKTALTTANTNLATEKKTVADLEKKLADNKAAYDKVEQARIAAVTTPVTTSASGSFEQVSAAQNLDAASIAAVSKSVEGIVSQTLGLQFSNELCTTLLVAQAYGRLPNESAMALTNCQTLLDSTIKRLNAQTAVLDKVAKSIEVDETPPPPAKGGNGAASAGQRSAAGIGVRLTKEQLAALLRAGEGQLFSLELPIDR